VIEIDAQQRWVRVEPGVVLDNLNAPLAPLGLQFGADVATASRATIGGMINNNSSGARSIVHGMTGDHVLELLVVLSDGSVCRFCPIEGSGLIEKRALASLEGALYREVPALAQQMAQEIKARFPAVGRRVSGYNLDAYLDASAPVDLSRLVSGSEGTLALILEAKLHLVPLPRHKAMVLVECSEVFSAATLVTLLVEHAPSAIELVDRLVLDQTRSSVALAPARALLKSDPGAVLVVEFCSDSLQELKSQVEYLCDRLGDQREANCVTPLLDPADQSRFWALRKAGVGLLMRITGDAKPYAFVEDTAVAPEKLSAYLRRFHDIVAAHHTTAGCYGHASVGCLHIRPIIDLKSVSGRQALRSILDEVSDLVVAFGGSLSGEHGDGVVRGAYIEKMFGSKLYQAFCRVKALFDPDGVLNPGRKVDTPDPLDDLRVLSRIEEIPQVATRFDYSEQGGFYRAVEMCSGVGECRKTLSGSMCPSYMATREEANATRGRANALRAALEGRLEHGLTNQQLYRAMDLCLACKACKTECPSGVDVARYKAEFLYLYQKRRGVTLRKWITARIDLVLKMLSPIAFLANFAARLPFARWLNEKLLGFDRRRMLPRFARRTFRSQYASRATVPSVKGTKQALLFTDCWMNYNEPQVGRAAVAVLEAAGYDVRLANTRCCGRPAISQGQLDRAIALAQHNISILYPEVEAGAIVVGIEPSCLLTMRDEYLDLLSGKAKEQARRVARSSLLVDELLAGLSQERWEQLRLRSISQKVFVHVHCHQNALVGIDSLRLLLARVPQLQIEFIDSGCCGMAGSFGYEVEHYAISQACFERILAPTLSAADRSQLVLAPGFSCRHQIAHFTGREAKHPIEFLANLLPTI
jgi:Fe-S oxidoreductase/FAD/FMN-containing dehydrogenase